jgi:Tfp pilus assembly protein PilX
MMKHARDNKGVALMMVLIISVIVLAVMAALIYMLTSGTQISGLSKRYSTALEAAQGGQSVMEQIIRARGDLDPTFETAINLTMPTTEAEDCLKIDKLIESTEDWRAVCNTSTIIDLSDPDTYDMKFDLGNYEVYAKIAQTIEGNSGQSDIDLMKTGVVESNAAEVAVQGVPYYYAVEIDSRNKNNLSERARISLLIQY